MVWITGYGWQCDCGQTSFVTVPKIADARANLRHHLKANPGHRAELVEVHDEEPDHDDHDGFDY